MSDTDKNDTETNETERNGPDDSHTDVAPFHHSLLSSKGNPVQGASSGYVSLFRRDRRNDVQRLVYTKKEREGLRKRISENMSYDILRKRNGGDEIEDFYRILCSVVCYSKDHYLVNGCEIPYEEIKTTMMQVNSVDAEVLVERVKDAKSSIKNMDDDEAAIRSLYEKGGRQPLEDENVVLNILVENENEARPCRNVTLRNKDLATYFEPDATDETITQTIIKLLEGWKDGTFGIDPD